MVWKKKVYLIKDGILSPGLGLNYSEYGYNVRSVTASFSYLNGYIRENLTRSGANSWNGTRSKSQFSIAGTESIIDIKNTYIEFSASFNSNTYTYGISEYDTSHSFNTSISKNILKLDGKIVGLYFTRQGTSTSFSGVIDIYNWYFER